MGEVARVTEITARSSESFEDAIQTGIQRATSTLRHVSGAWVKEQKLAIEEGQIKSYQVDMLVTFVLDDDDGGDGSEQRAQQQRTGQARGTQPEGVRH